MPFKTAGPAELMDMTNTGIVAYTNHDFGYWAKKLRVNNSSLKQLVPGGKFMPENVLQPANMVNLYLEELGDASVPNSTMPMPEGRSSDSSTLDTSSATVVN